MGGGAVYELEETEYYENLDVVRDEPSPTGSGAPQPSFLSTTVEYAIELAVAGRGSRMFRRRL